MNRPGQPPQRPPNIGPQVLSGPFRTPYPGAYGIPPRNPMQQQGYPGMPNTHRTTAQNVVLQTPNFIQQRGQASFPFGSTLQQQQTQQQQHQQLPLLHNQQQSASSTTVPPHLAQNATSSLGTAPSVSSASEVGLDPNDFPALGSTSTGTSNANANTNSPATNLASSYASQAGTGVPLPGGSSGGQSGSVGGTGSTQQSRDFTPDDFPALGGQSQSTQQAPSSQDATHPPGLNGFSGEHSQHRQGLLGTLPQQQQQQPGLLNLGSQRNVHPGFQSESEKRTSSFPNTLQNGGSGHSHLQQPHLNAPPGVPPPSSYQQPAHTANHQQQQQQQQFVGNSIVAEIQQHASQTQGNQTSSSTTTVPQTAAQQILMSPADRWGLLGLLAMIKTSDIDGSLLSVGTDLGTMGLDMHNPGNLYSTFITPWTDSSAAHSVEPDYHLPACYNVHPPPPGPQKAMAFSDETLFYMFYSSPRDALQEIASQELFNRNWRFHKDMRLWLTKEAGTRPSGKIDGGEQGTYTYWDPDNWEKQRKDLTVMYSDLEEKASPVFDGMTIQLRANVPTPAQQEAQRQVQQQLQTQTTQMPSAQTARGAFQGISMASAL
ncbi:hypothetical protein BD410DRAFT_791866 [Rickenella mellea]|uniref:NOT2/NOT3/NOT5 C-terminal domain-containing protein n=1 Tax=Rickenella mellea TaxID=50990 RepID=A0A4Y7PXF6_9AGAM|nr:hypothetical protein BD410DRAFT_791866 [Rickenella mellea]